MLKAGSYHSQTNEEDKPGKTLVCTVTVPLRPLCAQSIGFCVAVYA